VSQLKSLLFIRVLDDCNLRLSLSGFHVILPSEACETKSVHAFLMCSPAKISPLLIRNEAHADQF
jgi:hypothetical protein